METAFPSKNFQLLLYGILEIKVNGIHTIINGELNEENLTVRELEQREEGPQGELRQQQIAICTSTIMQLVCRPKILHKHCLQFLLGPL